MAYTPQFNPQPIGIVSVVTPGVPVQLTATLQITATGSGFIAGSFFDNVPTNKIFLASNPKSHAGAGNTGSVYIGQKTMNKATLQGVIAVIQSGGAWSITHPVGMNIYQFDLWYVDADNAGDGVYGTIDTI